MLVQCREGKRDMPLITKHDPLKTDPSRRLYNSRSREKTAAATLSIGRSTALRAYLWEGRPYDGT